MLKQQNIPFEVFIHVTSNVLFGDASGEVSSRMLYPTMAVLSRHPALIDSSGHLIQMMIVSLCPCREEFLDMVADHSHCSQLVECHIVPHHNKCYSICTHCSFSPFFHCIRILYSSYRNMMRCPALSGPLTDLYNRTPTLNIVKHIELFGPF